MKKTKFITMTALSLVLVLGSVGPAFAEDAKGIRSELKQTVKEEVQQKTQELRTTRAKRRSEALEQHCTSLNEKFTMVENKIQLRIDYLKKQGKNTDTAEQNLAKAKTQLVEAESICKQAVSKFDSVPEGSWSEKQPVLVEARKLAKQAHDAFVTVRKTLVLAISSLNNGLGEMKKGAQQ